MAKNKKTEAGNEKQDSIEYLCSVFFRYNKLTKQQQYCVRLETIKLFSALSYRLTVKAHKKKSEIDLNIMGLTPDQTYLQLVKPAASESYFDELYGDYKINIIKPDNSINSAVFNFNIFKKEIVLVNSLFTPGKNVRQFCTFETAVELNTFG
jgi:hypothetical protein